MAKRTKNIINHSEISDEIRLNKFLSEAGICSRRQADVLIEEGKVKVDDVIAVMGTKVKTGQKVTVEGKEITKDEKLVLIAFHKPPQIVCTSDKSEPDNIIDFINYNKRIFPIGRLDKDSEGLILLTNDGDIVNKILRAGNNHEKEYIVTVNKPLTDEFIKGMGEGVPILDTITKKCDIYQMDKFTFRIILTQGLNRQIRRMCEYFGYKVLTLKRIRIMNIHLGRLKMGDYRNVSVDEIKGLNELVSSSSKTSIASSSKSILKDNINQQKTNKDNRHTNNQQKTNIENRFAKNKGISKTIKEGENGRKNSKNTSSRKNFK